MGHFSIFIIVCFLQTLVTPNIVNVAKKEDLDDYHMHDIRIDTSEKRYESAEETIAFWDNKAQQTILKKLENVPVTGVAKNVIMFLGDGMSIPTLAATRVYLGRQTGKPGEEIELSFEKFPYVGLSKTYCVDSQVADSACSATAYLTGVKGNIKTIGVTAAVAEKDCEAMKNVSNHIPSIAHWSQLKGKSTGVVTTARVSHASPAGAYAHVAFRDWEAEAEGDCADITRQLIEGETGKKLNVVFGGGRTTFLPESEGGERKDGRNLINEWLNQKSNSSKSYIATRKELLNVDNNTDYVLGLFADSHVPYNLERNPEEDPSLSEMTQAAIKLLSKNDKGYFLFVEGGRIDHAHHDSLAKKAFDETVEFSKAIEDALKITDIEDTLIVVTSDHAHTMSITGYPSRGNNILGFVGKLAKDDLPYTTINYVDGKGYHPEVNGKRYDLSNDNLDDNDYIFPALVPNSYESHGGDDVGIFARGPWAHLLTGVVEQNVICHVMKYASCVGNGATACDEN